MVKLESIIEKVGYRNFFYMSPEAVYENSKSFMFVVIGWGDFFDGDIVEAEDDIKKFLEGMLSENEFLAKYKIDAKLKNELPKIKRRYLNKDNTLKVGLDKIRPEKLSTLNYNSSYLKTLIEWFYLAPDNGKRNFYTILKEQGFSTHKEYEIIRALLEKRYLVANGKRRKLTKPELFRLAKTSIIFYLSKKTQRHDNAPVNKSGLHVAPEVRGDLGEYAQFVERLRKLRGELLTLTYKEISDRHTPVKKKELVYHEYDAIAPLAHSQTLDFVSVLAKVQTQEEKFMGKKIILWQNNYLRATTWLPIEAKTVPNFGVFVDKLLTECRLRAYKEYNVNITDKELTISYPIHEAMLQFGYAETKEQAEDINTRKNFMKEFTGACKLLRDTEIEEKHGKKTKFSLVAKYTQEEVMLITFTSNFQQMVVANNEGHYAEELVLRSLASKIPNRKTTEYYLARYLVSINTNKNNIARGREDRLSLKSIIKHLEEYNALRSSDNTRNAQRKKINRLLEAFRWLKEHNIIDSYFYDSKVSKEPKPVELSADSYYLNTIQTLEELSSWYVIPELENFIDEHREEYTAQLVASQERAKEAKRKRAKKKANTSKEEEAPEENEAKDDLSAWEQ